MSSSGYFDSDYYSPPPSDLSKLQLNKPYKAYSVRVETADATMYVDIIEDDLGVPCEIMIHAGKTGSAVFAWADSVARMCSSMLRRGMNIYDIIQEFSNSTTSRLQIRNPNRLNARSGPDGLAVALLYYTKIKQAELHDHIKIKEMVRRPASFKRKARNDD
jgi:hypothetical protein